jgi:hypothetical protein
MHNEINILVNGSRCKQYIHDGKTFIEAKDGSEYIIEIKNNDCNRILAVCSVDGLDILTGKTALETSPGYVINAYNTGKFDGFRVSDEKVAKFLFGAKSDSYAASKEDNSEKNVGVIGIRLFEEKPKPAPVIREEHHHHHHDYWSQPRPYFGRPDLYPGTIWCNSTLSDTCGFGEQTYGSSVNSPHTNNSTFENCSADYIPTRSNLTKGSQQGTLRSTSLSAKTPRGFDIGTKWGESKESRVIEVDFERGNLGRSITIYYASRQSLIEMGVPLGNEKLVNFPEAFADEKYAKPPKGWKG